MKYVIDTSAYSAFNRGDARFRQVFSLENELIIPVVVLGELRAGFACGSETKKNEALLSRLLLMPNVTVVSPHETTTEHYAHIFAYLRKIGRPIGTNDLWIAAICKESQAILATLDTDYSAIVELAIFNPNVA